MPSAISHSSQTHRPLGGRARVPGRAFLHELHRRLVATLEPLVARFEIVLVEDGGPDESWSIIETLARKDARVRGSA